ncbi:hypothetical protein RZS08_00610, partial [Arthrospira platensis SPKY1]|nr:hypothetical protein [Arthrospira platensis SPKY1]
MPIAMLPPPTMQPVQLLLVMDKSPVGAAGVVHSPGVVTPTSVLLLRQPLAANTLARMVCAGPAWL